MADIKLLLKVTNPELWEQIYGKPKKVGKSFKIGSYKFR